MIVLLVIVLFLIVSLSALAYYSAEEDITSRFSFTMDDEARSLVEMAVLVDRGLTLAESTCEGQLKESFVPFLAAYENAGRDPAAIDLILLKEEISSQMGGTAELFLINESGVIEYTTYEPDFGLDFRKWPVFYESITALREGEAFSADRVTNSFAVKDRLMKYAYMPTPDHRYLLEIGFSSDLFLAAREDFSYSAVTAGLANHSAEIQSVMLYNSAFRKVGGTQAEDPELVETLNLVFTTKQSQLVPDRPNHTITQYVYIELDDQAHASSVYMNLVGEIVYSTKELDQILERTRMVTVVLCLLAIFLSVLGTYFLSRQLTRSVRSLVHDIDTIADGDLNHPIGETDSAETEEIRASTKVLVARLKEEMATIQDKSKTLNLELEERKAVEEALETANRKLNLLTGLTRHDLLNQLTALQVYHDLLQDHCNDDDTAKEYLKNVGGILENIGDQIDFTREYEEMGVRRPDWQDISALVQEIGSEKSLKTIAVKTETTGLLIRADPLIRKVIYNIFENARRHGGRVTEIVLRFYVAEDGQGVLVIEDNGDGIPASMKDRIFEKGFGKNTGFGLYLSRELLSIVGISIRETGEEGVGACFEMVLPPGSWRFEEK